MATVNVLNWKKEKVGSVELAADVFEAPVKKEVLHTVVQWQLAARRQGTHMTKTKGLVSGGGKKPFKQKRYWWSSSRFFTFSFDAWWWYYVRSTTS
ncbi:50S ribosomal protein L4 [Bdellovibrio bacteriovorus]|uniref:50S ribosomal protein L4 n=1 Tax=Bdellovibrio bacteriovorus TaxID=959 RepID=UPI0035A6E745